ncbi:enoyl-CoA hydratase/isomerase family protein [Streptomyces sp. RY43-2]|uniref:Enoyl-CoA hydratase/isomerase family protein n=1 Tax=Streptomyces macrolidinus TaxID=2952607 RepID=A0ABT0ZFK7_9ACTN|nr:enoyl-CoA hydratase/isomerase family protein [Streptomyces macrolidinus]MCN9242358.1 enoyl-CoA hydratase/isomerase family protein [Streptomyces macrolidinus]
MREVTVNEASMSKVTLELDGHVAVVEMHAPPVNFFDREILAAIADAGERATAEGARAIVLCSEGRHFCAGARLAGVTGALDARASAAAVYEQAVRIFRLEIPVVAAVQGAAVGGGLGLACAADFRVAGPKSRFEANFSRLGFHCGFALSLTLPRIVGQTRAELMLYTGRSLSGEEAYAAGLADRFAELGEERAVAVELARELAGAAPLAVRSMRTTMRAGLLGRLEATLEHELDEQEWLWRTEDAATGITASLERRDPLFHGR